MNLKLLKLAKPFRWSRNSSGNCHTPENSVIRLSAIGDKLKRSFILLTTRSAAHAKR